MIDILLVGAGGIAGSLARYKIGQWVGMRTNSLLPWGTYAINITGAILLGMLVALSPQKNTYALLGDGFLGAYTTFSTFMYESCCLIQEKEYKTSIIYLIGSVITGLFGFTLGASIISWFH